MQTRKKDKQQAGKRTDGPRSVDTRAAAVLRQADSSACVSGQQKQTDTALRPFLTALVQGTATHSNGNNNNNPNHTPAHMAAWLMPPPHAHIHTFSAASARFFSRTAACLNLWRSVAPAAAAGAAAAAAASSSVTLPCSSDSCCSSCATFFFSASAVFFQRRPALLTFCSFF